MPTYWITAHIEEHYIVEASDAEEAKSMIYDGDVTSRGEEIVDMTIFYEKDGNG